MNISFEILSFESIQMDELSHYRLMKFPAIPWIPCQILTNHLYPDEIIFHLWSISVVTAYKWVWLS
ncbi:8376_t:CDS:2 [Funneliformis mosseae]|uniref:8376_t:CDS:1 n=1 Tax=Funneliformis mosseae TaxID=27381 RepID=A0A9N9GNX3_FUNMO|nr:8376_t:CDS:2 [Funneliformis mosseae]